MVYIRAPPCQSPKTGAAETLTPASVIRAFERNSSAHFLAIFRAFSLTNN